ncbi:hypothetical protein [Leptolyngbya ohadii]|uniref:hypothetical protein n=1 Tax=Leptolyngbya ohadii TaxID=1962290 RepID=UPI0015C614A2|nr:hypothetical protein [Leptolyngbya ohadii]
MSFFDYSIPLLRCKSVCSESYADQKVWFVDWRIGKYCPYSSVYTRADQACIFWAVLVLPIFAVGQFSALDWTVQAILWTIASLFGLFLMVYLAKDWAKNKHVVWLLYCWSILIIAGLFLTDLGVFLRSSRVLGNLCSLWLAISSVGYLCSSVALHSRAFCVTGIIHLSAIWILPYMGGFQFLFTGTTMVFFLLILAELQWDMKFEKRCDIQGSIHSNTFRYF